MRNPSPTPHCDGCSRPEDEVPVMLSIRKGGWPTWLCSDCLKELNEAAQAVLRVRMQQLAMKE
jgi:hypothetical protein